MSAPRRCTGTNRQGNRCGRAPVRGAMVCKLHGGAIPKVAAKARVRAELEDWGLTDSTTDIDPVEIMLRLVSQSARRAEQYAAELERLVGEHDTLTEALTGESLIMDPQSGTLTKISEYTRSVVQLEAQERDRLGKFSKLCVDAGVAERRVALAEKQGAMIAAVLQAAFDQLALSEDQRRAAPAAIRAALSVVGELEGGA